MTDHRSVHTGISCPREYQDRKESDLKAAILAHKERLGKELTILGHHYQGDGIVELSDFVGDSFKLCRDAANSEAKHIIFCGVRFMAESARILAREDQVVIHPEESSGCPMADMADLPQIEQAWAALTALNPNRRIVPITYMNSNSELKAFCGARGGSVCTSSNAERVLKWAYGRGDMVLFFPDEHLGRNTAHNMGMEPEDVLVWNPRYADAHARDERYSSARLVVWKGFCVVHTHFKVEHIREMREANPEVFVIVHPERGGGGGGRRGLDRGDRQARDGGQARRGHRRGHRDQPRGPLGEEASGRRRAAAHPLDVPEHGEADHGAPALGFGQSGRDQRGEGGFRYCGQRAQVPAPNAGNRLRPGPRE
jgi:quinolinate synthetase A subunit